MATLQVCSALVQSGQPGGFDSDSSAFTKASSRVGRSRAALSCQTTTTTRSKDEWEISLWWKIQAGEPALDESG